MKNDIKAWAAPLIIFIVAEFLFLIFLLFMPAVDAGIATTAAATSTVNATFRGWSWLMTPGVGRALAMLGYQVMVFFAVGVAFLRSRI